ncbi:MAG: Multidrug resistance protein MdtA [Steroidobacteraceae bacterium]|nr:Multidrug resistance protein MdtA [Steroidobacteraceae bacterium]
MIFREHPFRIGLALLLAGAVTACGSGAGNPAPSPVEGLATLTVGAGEAGPGRSWDGVVEAVRQATLSAQTSGRVAEVRHDVNDRVAAGAVLVRLSAVEQQAGVAAARAQLRAAEATLVEVEGNFGRYVDLYQRHYVSKAQLDQMRATRDAAQAARDAARAQVANTGQQSAYTTIRAPYAGIVSSRDVEPGESVGVGRQLMTLFSPDALRVEVSVPQSVAMQIRARPLARITFEDGRSVDARDVTVFPSADSATHAVTVRVQLPALDPIPHPGGTAKVLFPAVEETVYPRIPAATLVRRGEVTAVYVLAGGRLSLRQLRLGEESGGEVDVIAGLKPGEVIARDPVAAVQALVAARKGAG